MSKNIDVDVLVIGAGIAGASIAAALSSERRVAVIDREAQAGYHSTGRSAASFLENYGSAAVRALARASRSFFVEPDEGFSEYPLAKARPTLMIARSDQNDALDAYLLADDVAANVLEIDGKEARKLVPILNPESCHRATFEESCMDLDVNQLLQAYLRQARQRGAQLFYKAQAVRIERAGQDWRVDIDGASIRAGIVVNAAGAWADEVADLVGLPAIGLSPLRRSACTVPAPGGMNIDEWPLTINIDEEFYFKPDAGTLLLSSADATLSAPCDAAPEEIDIAMAIARVEEATSLTVSRPISRWAGLRTFTPDKTPAIGFDANIPSFFWLAGQGGYGVLTAPAAAAVAASLILGRPLPDRYAIAADYVDCLSPGRFSLS